MEVLSVYYNDIWTKTKNVIKNSQHFEGQIYTTYFEDSSLAVLSEEKAVIVVPTYFQKLILNQEINVISESLKQIVEREVTCEVMLESEFSTQSILGSPRILNESSFSDGINIDQTFDNFIVGPSNKESHAASLACAYNPGKFYNPLFIYGNSGLGKTHLLNAIGNYVKKKNSNARVYYTSSSDFVNKVVYSIRDNSIDTFKEQMNQLDVLLMDDIQFLAGKEKSHEVFFHIFNELVNNHKQIIITSDRHPTEIKGLENRLISRFSSGLSVGIDSPEFETAVAILKMKIQNQSVDSSMFSEDVINYIALNFSQDVRVLEGALNRLIFYNIEFSNHNEIDLATAIQAFKGQSTSSELKEVSISRIKKVVADYYGLTKQQLTSKNRTKAITTARHIAIYLCRKHLDLPFIKIGQEFGKRDHSTIMSSCEKVEKALYSDPLYQQAITEIEDHLLG